MRLPVVAFLFPFWALGLAGGQTAMAAYLPPELRSAMEDKSREIRSAGQGYWAANPGHHLTIGFTKEATVVTTREGSVRWRFAGYGRGNRISDLPCSIMTAKANRLSYHRGALTEWYVNDERGLEQGFTAARRPRGSGPIVVALALEDGAVPLAADKSTVQLVRNRRTLLRYGGLKAWDSRGRVLHSELEVRLNQIRLIVDDASAAYPITIDPWVQNTKLSAGDRAAGDYAGYAVAASESTAVVGAFGKNGFEGAAYVYARNGASWVQQAKLTPEDGSANTYFGVSVALSRDTVLIGASGSGDYRGAAYVFVRRGTTWTQQAKLTAADGATGDTFGGSVALHGDTALIGAFAKNNWAGAAYIFNRQGRTWTQQAKLAPADGASQDYFGWSVALRRNTAIVGAYGQNANRGAAYAYSRGGTAWTLQEKLTAPDGSPNDYFGYSVAVSETLAAVGAYGKGGFRGSVYVFRQSGTSWTQRTQIAPSDGIPGDEFGYSVAVHGPTVLVGSWGQAGAIGAAYLFLAPAGTESNQVAKLTAADGAISDFFGWSVALAGDTAIVGAYGESAFAGAAYVFENPCTVDLRLSYSDSKLVIGYTVGATDPGRWTGWLSSSAGAKRLWQRDVEATSTPLTGSSQIPDFPSLGTIGILASLTTTTGSRCSDFQTINTGGAPTAIEQLRSVAEQAGLPVP